MFKSEFQAIRSYKEIYSRNEGILVWSFWMDSYAIGIFALKNYNTLAISDVHKSQTVSKIVKVRTGI